jgi:hypothetical protein
VFPLSQDDWLSAKVQVLKVELDTSIQEKIGDKRLDVDCFAEFPEVAEVPEDIFLDDEPTSVPVEGEELMPEADEYYSPEAYDQYLTASMLMDRGGEAMLGKVKNRKRDSEGNPVGHSNMNPLLDNTEKGESRFSFLQTRICRLFWSLIPSHQQDEKHVQ